MLMNYFCLLRWHTNAIACDTISHAHTVVQVIWGSEMYCDALDDVITNGNSKGWFKADVVGILICW